MVNNPAHRECVVKDRGSQQTLEMILKKSSTCLTFTSIDVDGTSRSVGILLHTVALWLVVGSRKDAFMKYTQENYISRHAPFCFLPHSITLLPFHTPILYSKPSTHPPDFLGCAMASSSSDGSKHVRFQLPPRPPRPPRPPASKGEERHRSYTKSEPGEGRRRKPMELKSMNEQSMDAASICAIAPSSPKALIGVSLSDLAKPPFRSFGVVENLVATPRRPAGRPKFSIADVKGDVQIMKKYLLQTKADMKNLKSRYHQLKQRKEELESMIDTAGRYLNSQYKKAYQITKKGFVDKLCGDMTHEKFPWVVSTKNLFSTPTNDSSTVQLRAFFDVVLCVSKEDERPIMVVFVQPPFRHGDSYSYAPLTTETGLRECKLNTEFHVTCARHGAGISTKRGVTLNGFCTDGKTWYLCETHFHPETSSDDVNSMESSFRIIPREELYDTMCKAWTHNLRVANEFGTGAHHVHVANDENGR